MQHNSDRLVELVKECRGRIVALTGAGISTSAGIPDFRGPRGIWTLERREERRKGKKRRREEPRLLPVVQNNGNSNDSNKKAKRGGDDNYGIRDPDSVASAPSKTESAVGCANANASKGGDNNAMDFAGAEPTYTHRAVARLVREGVFRFVVTQNVDGLHRRSGLSRAHHAVLHGCAFTEKCEDCGAEHFRDFDCGGMSFQVTGRQCQLCAGRLRDTLLDWEDELPEDDLERATAECEGADLVLCLGTSLRIDPAGKLPTLARKYAIVNLQETPYDKDAALVIGSRVDDIMKRLMERLGFKDGDDGETSRERPPIERIWRPNRNKDEDSSGGLVDPEETSGPPIHRICRPDSIRSTAMSGGVVDDAE